MKKLLITLLAPIFFFFFLSSCKSEVGFQTQSEIITETASITSSSSPSSIPTNTSTATITPTQKPSPSSTTNPEDATWVAYSETMIVRKEEYWDNIYAELEQRGVSCKDGYKLEFPDYIVRKSTDEWTVFTCSPEPENIKDRWTPGVVDFNTRYTKVIKTDFSQSWEIFFDGFTWANRPDSLLSSYRWTADGNYLYLVPITYPRGSGFYARGYFIDGGILYRLNLITGQLEDLFSDVQGIYGFSLSPDDQYLAFVTPAERDVVNIWDMSSDEIAVIELGEEYDMAGAFAWTPDSSKLLFAAATDGWLEGAAGISIFKLTINNMYLQMILYNDDRLLIPIYHWELKNYWLAENILNLTSLDYPSENYSSQWTLDISTGIVTGATPTPRP